MVAVGPEAYRDGGAAKTAFRGRGLVSGVEERGGAGEQEGETYRIQSGTGALEDKVAVDQMR